MTSMETETRTTRTTPESRRQGPAAIAGWIFGIAFLIVGIWGFFETGFTDWVATDTDASVLGFQVNPLHNVVHLLVGGALLAGAATGERGARAMGLLVAVVYAIVGIAGFWATGADWNILALNTADNWLHIVTAAILFIAAAASMAMRSEAPSRAPRRRGERSYREQTA